MQKTRTVCRMCHGGCGVIVHHEDGEIRKIEGDKENPLSKGKLCVKPRGYLEYALHSDRLKHPIRKGGEGEWKQISWGEALNTIAEKLNDIKEEFGPESVAIFQGTGRHHWNFVPRFANAFGTPNWTEPGLAQCFFPRVTVGKITYGDYLVNDYYNEDISPSCVLVWGHNPIVSSPDGELAWPFLEALDKGAYLIVVDPRRTVTASKADMWIQIRPGTDDALALSMLNVIIQEKLFDRKFVEKWVSGFGKLKEHVQDYTPQWAEEITWIKSDKIREVARKFAKNKPGCLEVGVALEHTPNSFQTLRAIFLLPALTGNIDVPGGWKFGADVEWAVPTLQDELSAEMKYKRLGSDKFKLLSTSHAVQPSAHIPALLNAMKTGKPYPIKTLLLFGNNGLVGFANPGEVYEAMKKLDFIAAADLFMTPTTELADIVLPAASWLEVDSVAAIPYFGERIVLVQKKIAQVGECRQDEEILIQLSRKLGLESNVEPLEKVYDQQLEPLGLSFEKLKERNYVFLPLEYKKYEDDGFDTPSGKIEAYSKKLDQLGYAPLPIYRDPPESPVSTPDMAEKYPLILTTGGRLPQYFHSELRQVDSLRETHPDPLVEIHPETAKERGIDEGNWVFIENERGKIKQKAKVTDRIHPQVVNCEHGWWFPERDPPEYGVWESNANLLTNNKPPYDPAMGSYQLRALLCDVYPPE